MPRPAHQMVTYSGVLGPSATPVEQWQFSLRLQDGAFNSAALSVAAAAAMQPWNTSLAPIFSTNVHLTRVRIADIGTDGRVAKTADAGYSQGDWTGLRSGTVASTTVLPPQCSVVVSLQSAAAGAVGKGRIFLPQTSHRPGVSDLLLSTTDQQAILTASKAFLDGVIAATTTTPKSRIVVASAGSSVTGQAGALYPVVSVRVGRAIDTHRSRRGDLVESHVSTPLA